jgi:hypothetical protein
LEQVLDELEERLQNYPIHNPLQEEQAALPSQVQALEEERLLGAATNDLLRQLFAIYEQQGNEAAWQWARDQVTIRSQSLEVNTDRVLNIMMFDIDEDVASLFSYDNYDQKKGETKEEETKHISKEQTVWPGINELYPRSHH